MHTDPHNSGKEIVYAGIPLVDVLKVSDLVLDSGIPGTRETVTVTVLIEATDGYRAVFSLAELERTVYGLNSRRANFVIALSLVTYEHAL